MTVPVLSALYAQTMMLLGVNLAVSTQSNQAVYRLTADSDNSTTAFSDVTDLSWSIGANATQVVTCAGAYTTAATTTAIQLSFNGPASPTNIRTMVTVATTATGWSNASQSAYDAVLNPATGAGATARPFELRATIENGANAGTIVVRQRSEIAASSATILRGATCFVITL